MTVRVPTFQNGPLNVLWVSEYYQLGDIPPAPRTAQMRTSTWSAGTNTDCNDCIVYSIGCTLDMGSATGLTCTEDYLAQSGTLSVTAQTLVPDAGTFTGSISTMHFIQYNGINNTNPDGPVSGGKCIDISTGSFNATWP